MRAVRATRWASSVMPTSSRMTTLRSSRASRSWSSRHSRLANVRDSPTSASLPKVRAACPEVAVPITWQPDAS